MLTPCFAKTEAAAANIPGLSGTSPTNFTILLWRAIALLSTLTSVVASMLPPDTTATAFLPSVFTLPVIKAATDAAPAPSAITLVLSASRYIASAISLSSTSTTSSTYLSMNDMVSSPGRLTAMPSAIVSTLSNVTIRPSLRDLYTEGAPDACTP